MKSRLLLAVGALGAAVHAESAPDTLPSLTVYSRRVANQAPVATFAMPISALRFEPGVDVQARNFAEGQADVSIRGGIFENTGFRVGSSSLLDPQTGHYFAEIPVAPAMLTAPEVVTGADLALQTANATSGAVAYGWRPVVTAGAASVGMGGDGLVEGEFYQGYRSPRTISGRHVAADVAWAHSEADGSVPFGDHELDRVNARLQWAGGGSQTDLFAGYQAKYFGWPNLYTPYGYDETENLKTLLVAFNHRVDQGAGEFVDFGAYYRRNRDEYILSRQKPSLYTANHATWVRGASLAGRRSWMDLTWNFRAEALADQLTSTALVFGRYRSRTLTKFSLAPERGWTTAEGTRYVLKAGATYDDSNRTGSAVSPVVEWSREARAPLSRVFIGYAEATQLPTYTALNSSATSGLFRGNPNLGRETSRNLEAGGRLQLLGWTADAAVFHRQDDDLVDWTFQRGVTARAANAVDIDTTGFEAVARRSWGVADVVIGYTWLTKDADYRSPGIDASFYALNYARQRVTAAITVRLTRSFELRIDNEVRVQAANALRTRGGDRPILTSLGLTYRPAAVRRLSLSAQVDNLWDSGFQEVPAVPAARRQFSGVIGYAW